MRPPTTSPPGLAFHFQVLVNGTPLFSLGMTDLTTRERTLTDLALNVAPYAALGNVPLTFQLVVVGPGTPVAAEMPGLYLDAVILDTSTARPVLMRIPAPGETGVLVSEPIGFAILDPGMKGVAPSSVTVTINGVVVQLAGVVQSGTGFTRTLFQALDAWSYAYVFAPSAPFQSLQVVTVNVTAATVDGATLDETYSFTIEDIVAPTISSALALDPLTVRITWSKAVLQSSAAGAHDALNPANYALTLLRGVPAVLPGILGVVSFAGSVVLLDLDTELTAGATYQLTVTNISDTLGNTLLAVGAAAAFLGFTPQPVPGRDVDLYSMLPLMNRREDMQGSGDLKRFIACLQEVFNLLLYDVDTWTEILDPDKAPEAFLDAMLVDMGNPFTQFTLTLADKRKLVQLLVPIYQRKGTDLGMVDVIRLFLGLEVTVIAPANVQAWTLGQSELGLTTTLASGAIRDLYSFWLISPVGLTPDQRTRIQAIVNYMRRAPCHFLGIREPAPPPAQPNHWQLGFSELGVQTWLHL
jgi:phage tail-like protein